MWVAREIVSQQKGRTSSVWSANRIIYIQHVCPSCKDFWLNKFHIQQLHKIVNVSFDVKFHFDAKMGDAKVTSNHTNVALIVGNIFLLVFATSKSNANILPTRLDLLCLLCTRSVQIQAFRVGVWHVFQSIWHWNSGNQQQISRKPAAWIWGPLLYRSEFYSCFILFVYQFFQFSKLFYIKKKKLTIVSFFL